MANVCGFALVMVGLQNSRGKGRSKRFGGKIWGTFYSQRRGKGTTKTKGNTFATQMPLHQPLPQPNPCHQNVCHKHPFASWFANRLGFRVAWLTCEMSTLVFMSRVLASSKYRPSRIFLAPTFLAKNQPICTCSWLGFGLGGGTGAKKRKRGLTGLSTSCDFRAGLPGQARYVKALLHVFWLANIED